MDGSSGKKLWTITSEKHSKYVPLPYSYRKSLIGILIKIIQVDLHWKSNDSKWLQRSTAVISIRFSYSHNLRFSYNHNLKVNIQSQFNDSRGVLLRSVSGYKEFQQFFACLILASSVFPTWISAPKSVKISSDSYLQQPPEICIW